MIIREPEPRVAAPEPPARQTGVRDPLFDNAKFFAVLLVVVGHAIEPLRHHSRPAAAVYLWIYLFHMPAFVVVSGYFSRGFDYSRGKVQRLVAGTVVPYFVFEFAYTAIARYGGHHHLAWSPLDPYYLVWFLAALFVWRLTAAIWRALRRPLAVAVAISLAANLSGLGTLLDITRILELLPFFVAGMMLRREHFSRLDSPRVRAAAAGVLAVAFAVAFAVAPHLSPEWVYWRKTLVVMHVPLAYGLPARAALLAGAGVLVAAFFAVVPRRRAWYSRLGAGTVYAYLLHGIVTRAARHLGLYAHLGSPLGVVLVAVGAAVLAVVLMTRPVRTATRFAIEPRLDWAFRRA